MTVDSESDRVLKEISSGCLQVLYQSLAGGSDENHEKYMLSEPQISLTDPLAGRLLHTSVGRNSSEPDTPSG